MPKLLDKLEEIREERQEPLWKGPCSTEWNGGVSQSMLSQFLVCKERFRIKYMLGLRPPDSFMKAVEYGHMWHACEEAHVRGEEDLYKLLDEHVIFLCNKHPLNQEDIVHWHNICKLQFPIYQRWWDKHEDMQNRTPLLQEANFNVLYALPSGNEVLLKGKWDSVDKIDDLVWLQENKTKGDINPVLLQRQLTFDLQSMLYLVALRHYMGNSIAGIRYNVIRRPLSGGKGSIRQKKNQTLDAYYKELTGIIKGATGSDWGVAPNEHFFFMRWNVEVSSKDLVQYENQFLIPILTELDNWYDEQAELMEAGKSPFDGKLHYRTPYGLYSPLYGAMGGTNEMDEYIMSGSLGNLRRADKLFRELQ